MAQRSKKENEVKEVDFNQQDKRHDIEQRTGDDQESNYQDLVIDEKENEVQQPIVIATPNLKKIRIRRSPDGLSPGTRRILKVQEKMILRDRGEKRKIKPPLIYTPSPKRKKRIRTWNE